MVKLDVGVVGIGMTKFGKYPHLSLKELGAKAVQAALDDAKMEPSDIDASFVANAMASVITGQVSIVGQTILRACGFQKIPAFNIDNACAGSSSALHLAAHYIASGAARHVLVLGVEKLVHEDRTLAYRALNGAADIDFTLNSGIDSGRESVFVSAIYPPRLAAYKSQWGIDANALARISVKNRRHAANNPVAQFVEPITAEQVLSSRMIVDPITALMCAPIGDGASAVILSAAKHVRQVARPVWLRGTAVGMGASPSRGESSVRTASEKAYEQAGMKPTDIHLAEVHDSIAFNELLAYEELGFCTPGAGGNFALDGHSSLGGKLPVNTSGGLESRGHPVAATGTAQICELVLQLRGDAGARQVKGARIGLSENAGGFAVDDTAAIAITILEA